MDVIKAEKLGLYFNIGKSIKRSLRYALTTPFNREGKEERKFWALKDVSFTVGYGETLGVIGRNGSGKSTLLRIIGGIYPPDEGRIEIKGKLSTLLSMNAGFQSDLSGVENIYLTGMLMRYTKSEIDILLNDIIDFADLGNFINMPVKTYSSGMHARLGFAIAVNVKEDIVLVDEILGVGDAKFQVKARAKMEEIMTEGRTIVLVSHNMDTIGKFSNKVLWLHQGEVMGLGPPEEVISQYLDKK